MEDKKYQRKLLTQTQAYKNYILEHLDNVQKCFEDLQKYDNIIVKTFLLNKPEVLRELGERVKIHDASKWGPEEFEPYRKNFYPINDQEKRENSLDFDKAWEHHWKTNDHHWQNRVNTETLNEPACWEMILDWMAMGMKFGDKAYSYYRKNKENIYMNEIETDFVETILDYMELEDRGNCKEDI